MGKLNNSVLILGEGPTEFFYLKSLADTFKHITIKPDYPKHTNLQELEQKIKESVDMGYSHIFCMIDMDTKESGPERTQYLQMKTRYAKVIDRPRKGIFCKVEFFETHRCSELFFLYYFRYTSKMYSSQDALIEDLNRNVEYRKTIEFFIKTKGLHSYFEKNGGSLAAAVENAEHSVSGRQSGIRDYTYSELGRMIKQLEEIEGNFEMREK